MNILVVDDEDMIREGVAAFLREEGYHVILAKDGQVAKAESFFCSWSVT